VDEITVAAAEDEGNNGACRLGLRGTGVGGAGVQHGADAIFSL
jgi:hypothetical protein